MLSDDGSKRRDRSARRSGSAAALAIVLLCSIIVLVRAVGIAASPSPATAATPATAAAAAPTFRPTAQQLKSLTIDRVSEHDFASEEITEGKIGANGDRTTQVMSPYTGRVTKVSAGLGDVVKAGAPLAAVQANEFVQVQNDLHVAVAQLQLARLTETRKHALYEAKGGSLQDWQQAQADLSSAQTALDAARSRLLIFGKSPAAIASLERRKAIEPLATLAAPISGVIIDRQVGPGQYLQAGAPAAFTIADASSVWLLASVREADAGRVKVGQPVEVRVPAYPERIFKARITHVAAAVDPVTHRLTVRAPIDNSDGALKIEMFASFRILTSAAQRSAAVPDTAVVHEGTAAHVWVMRDGLLTLRAIRTGRSNEGLVEVLEGLSSGEQVVTHGGIFVDQAANTASS